VDKASSIWKCHGPASDGRIWRSSMLGWRIRQEYRHLEKTRNPPPFAEDRLCELGRYGQKTMKGMVSIRREPPCERGSRSRRPGAAVERRGRNPAAANFRRGDRRSLHLCAGPTRARAFSKKDTRCAAVRHRTSSTSRLWLSTLSKAAHVARRHGGIAKRFTNAFCDSTKLHGEAWAPAPLLKRLAEAGKLLPSLTRSRVRPGCWSGRIRHEATSRWCATGKASFLEADYDKLCANGEAQARLLGKYWLRRGMIFHNAYAARVCGNRRRRGSWPKSFATRVIVFRRSR